MIVESCCENLTKNLFKLTTDTTTKLNRAGVFIIAGTQRIQMGLYEQTLSGF